MKFSSYILAAVLIGSVGSACAASTFWSFQTDPAGGSYNGPTTGAPSGGTATSASGFQGTPDLSAFVGSGGGAVNGILGGLNYTDPATGTTWESSGTSGAGSVGYGLQWGSNETQNLTGAGFTIALNTTGLTGLVLRFDVRSAQSGSALGAPTGFSAINYRLNGTGGWLSVGATGLPTWAVQSAWQTEKVVDLSAYGFLEGKENIELQFIFNGGPKDPDLAGAHNLRIDNLLLTAVPESSSMGFVALSAVSLLRRRR